MSCLSALLALKSIILVVTSVPPPKPACVMAWIGAADAKELKNGISTISTIAANIVLNVFFIMFPLID